MNAETKHKPSLLDLESRLRAAQEDYLAVLIKEEVEDCLDEFLRRELAAYAQGALRQELGDRWLEEEVAGQVEKKIQAYRQVIRDELNAAQREFDVHVAKWTESFTDSLLAPPLQQKVTLWQWLWGTN